MPQRAEPFEQVSLRGAPRSVRVLIGLTSLLSVAYCVSVVPGMPGRPGAIGFWETWITSIAFAGAALICLARAHHVRGDRAAWILMSLALLSTAAGSAGWAIVYSGATDVPAVTFADALWLGFYPLTYGAVLLLALGSAPRMNRSMWLDGLVSGLAFAALGAVVAYDRLVAHASGEPLAVAVNLAYPVGDLLLITLVIGIFGASGWRPGRAWLLLGIGLLVNAAADTVYLLQVAGDNYVEGTWLDALWLPATLLMATSAWQPMWMRAPGVEEWRSVAVPSISTLLAVGVLAVAATHDERKLAVALATAAALASVLRTSLAFHEVSQLLAVRRLALTDELTGLPNRRALTRSLDGAITGRRPIGLLLIDLDGFKELNDTLGHQVGDQLLARLGERLTSGLRAGDLLARLGGDEFAVLLHETEGRAAARAAAERLRATLEEPFVLDEIPLRVDASIGIAMFPAQAANAVELLKHADVAMYQAKREGRGIAAYDAGRDVHSRDRLVLLGQLRDGIACGELELHYQPQIDVATGELRGLEALVRWRHPEHGLLTPDAFLPSVEQTNIMRPFTENVVAAALEQAAGWAGGPLDVPVSVNVAAPNLVDSRFPETVGRLLMLTGVEPARLRVEVTENAVMVDADRALVVLGELHAMGVRVSIDDFGTGHSSLARLRSMPVDELKIDKAFVMAMDDCDDDAAIVEAAITLAHRLGLRVTAEGVESAGVHARLLALGCDIAQGYLFSRPLPAAHVEQWVHARVSSTVDRAA